MELAAVPSQERKERATLWERTYELVTQGREGRINEIACEVFHDVEGCDDDPHFLLKVAIMVAALET